MTAAESADGNRGPGAGCGEPAHAEPTLSAMGGAEVVRFLASTSILLGRSCSAHGAPAGGPPSPAAADSTPRRRFGSATGGPLVPWTALMRLWPVVGHRCRGSGGRPCQWQPKTAHLRQLKTAYFRGGRLGRVRTCSCQATLKTDPRKNGVCRSTTMIRVGPVSSAPSRRASAGSGQQRTGEHARGSGRRRRFPPGAVGRADTGCNPETAVPVRRAPNPAIPPRPVSVVDGRDAPSRPGRKAHNCHLSRGADGVSPGGP